MPTYEYKCLECERRFDVYQSMTDEPVQTCATCGGKVKRLIGAGAGFLFRGSGFYTTDYRSDSYQKAASKENSSPAAGASSESKPAEKSSPTTSTVAEGSTK